MLTVLCKRPSSPGHVAALGSVASGAGRRVLELFTRVALGALRRSVAAASILPSNEPSAVRDMSAQNAPGDTVAKDLGVVAVLLKSAAAAAPVTATGGDSRR